MKEITITLNTNSSIPMYEQIYNHIKKEIKDASIASGVKLPSTRYLAQYLDVSRSTTQMAYDQLLSEGYIESIPCKGYYTCAIDGLYDLKNTIKKADIKKEVSTNTVDIESKYKYSFSPRGVDLSIFPFNSWRKVTRNVLSNNNIDLFNIGESKGEESLRNTICEYLHSSRGVNCDSSQIIIGAGNDYLLMLLNNLLPSDAIIAMESPTYVQAYKTFTTLGRTVLPINMDNSGLSVDELTESMASIAYVMPSHQYPLGIVMPVKRRIELLNWAKASDARYIIEDDYDSEFRYKGKPIPALQGSDTNDNVIYLGTFSKAIAPAIRVSYMVLPVILADKYNNLLIFCSSSVSRIDQNIINEFITDGYYERHLNKMRALYKSRHDALINALKPFEAAFTISGENAGIHILLTSKTGKTEEELIRSAADVGVRVYPLSDYYIGNTLHASHNTIILGYSKINDNDMIEGINLLKKAWL